MTPAPTNDTKERPVSDRPPDQRLGFGVFFALIDRRGNIVSDQHGDPQIFSKIGPHFEGNAVSRNQRVIRVRIVEARHD